MADIPGAGPGESTEAGEREVVGHVPSHLFWPEHRVCSEMTDPFTAKPREILSSFAVPGIMLSTWGYISGQKTHNPFAHRAGAPAGETGEVR